MPLVNGIICFLNHALLSSLCHLQLKFMAYVPKMLQWVEPMPSLTCVNLKNFTGDTHLVFDEVKLPTLMPFPKRKVNVRLCSGEVEVDLEPCVHAHGPDVELIMEASCKNYNNPLVISSYCIYAWTFAIVVPTMTVFL